MTNLFLNINNCAVNILTYKSFFPSDVLLKLKLLADNINMFRLHICHLFAIILPLYDPVDCSLSGCPDYGKENWSRLPFPPPGDLSNPGIETVSPTQAGQTSVQFSHSVLSSSLQIHGLRPTKALCSSPTARAYWNSCPLSRWCPPTISSSLIPFSSCFQSFPASGSFQMSQL